MRQFVARPAEDPELDEIEIAFVRLSATSVAAIAERLRARPGVVSVETTER